MARRAKRPLNQEAVAAANAAVHDQTDPPGRSLHPSNRADADLRRQWMDAYVAAGGELEGDPPRRRPPADPVEPCPECGGQGALVVRVLDNDGNPIEDAIVNVDGIGGNRTNTDGVADYGTVDPDTYTFTAEKEGFAPSDGAPIGPVTRSQSVPADQTTVVDLVLVFSVKIEIVSDHDDDKSVDENSPTMNFVRFGLWDNAFTAAGALENGSAETDNFIGSDSRRFYFRVKDPTATNNQIDIDWKTLNSGRADESHTPATKSLTLEETAAGSKVFVSKAVMLVTDNHDHSQATDSGLPVPLADAGQRNRGQSNHRIRRGSLTGFVKGEYTALGRTVNVELPIFRHGRTDQRRRIPLQIFVLRVAAGGAPVTPTGARSALRTRDLRVIRESYARIGLAVDTVVAPGTSAGNIVTHGGDSIVEIDPPAGVAPANVSFAHERTIATAHPAMANTIRVFYVGGLASGNGGEARSDALAPVGNPLRATVFTIHTTGPYAAAHEVGHVLTDKRGAVPTDGHFLAPPGTPKLTNDQNLMKREFLGAEGVLGAKRLWDDNDGHGFNQYDAIRGSHYTRNF